MDSLSPCTNPVENQVVDSVHARCATPLMMGRGGRAFHPLSLVVTGSPIRWQKNEADAKSF